MKINNRGLFLAAAAVVSFGLAVAGAEPMPGWPFKGTVQETSVVAAPLWMSFYMEAEENFANVRVHAVEADSDVPFFIRRRMVRETRTRVERMPLNIARFQFGPDATAELVCEAMRGTAERPLFDTIEFDTPLKDFEQTVQVFAESSSNVWAALGEAQPIYDYSSHAPVRRTSVRLPKPMFASKFRFSFAKAEDKVFSRRMEVSDSSTGTAGIVEGRVKRYEVEQRPFKVNAVAALYTVQEIVETKPVESVALEFPCGVKVDAKAKTTTVGGALLRMPVNGLAFQIADKNFERGVKIEACPMTGDITSIAEEKVSRTTLPGDHHEKIRVNFAEARPWVISAVFADHDNAPLKIGERFTAFVVPYDICFIAEPGESYILRFLDKKGGKPPVYESEIESYLRAGHDFVPWTIKGPQITMTSLSEGTPLKSRFQTFLHRHGLTTVSVLLIAVLGLLCFLALKKAR
jgi:hypothetical protein